MSFKIPLNEFTGKSFNEIIELQQKKIIQFNNNKVKAKRELKNALEDINTGASVVSLDVKGKGLSLKDIFNDVIRKIDIDDRVVIKVGNNNFTLSEKFRKQLGKSVERYLVEDEEMVGSDYDALNYIRTVGKFELINMGRIINKKQNIFKYAQKKGRFFPYFHNVEGMDFTRYQLFENKEQEDYRDNCLLYALRKAGVEDRLVDECKSFMTNREIPISKLEMVAEVIQRRINLIRYEPERKDKDSRSTVYGKEFTDPIDLGLVEEHYFINEKTEITSYALDNYETIKNEKNFNYINKVQIKNGKQYYNREKSKCIDSYTLFKKLLEHKESLLTAITIDNSNILDSPFYSKINEIKYLEYDERNTKPYNEAIEEEEEHKEDEEEKKEKVKYKNIFFDFETYTDKDEDGELVHVPYLCAFTDGDTIGGDMYITSYYSPDCAERMLNSFKENVRLIAHNASYDYRFIVKKLFGISEISRGNKIISVKGFYYNPKTKKTIRVIVKDSYNLINMPLRDFNKAFKLGKDKKEIMPYEYFNNIDNLNKRKDTLENVIKYIKDEEKEEFIKRAKEAGCLFDGDIYMIDYAKFYCEKDCEVLAKGYNTFREWMTDLCQLDIDGIATIASLADKYMISQGVYDGVMKLSGAPREFIQRAVVGGRVMCRNNKKAMYYGVIQDFDAVSLYPSAMSRMGFLKGCPKVLKTTDYNKIKNYDGYFIEIEITGIKTKRSFPLISFKEDEDGIRNFTNDVIGRRIIVDKITLEDFITYHGISFNVIRGYYYDEGFNYKIKQVISNLFNERKKLKKADNGAEIVYKLILNSSYGKTIMKPVEKDLKFFYKIEDFITYFNRNYNYIKSFIEFSPGKYRVEITKPINEHFSAPHIGSSILAMSKRIMNEVICTAEDNDIKIFYQDTDSMHLYEEDIRRLQKIFFEKYERELIGEDLGQFHSDFSLKVNGEKLKDVKANYSIFLGKKSYIDRLEGTDKDGNKHQGYHIRLKGIPNSTILFTVDEQELATPTDLYELLFFGDRISFDLTNGGDRVNFKYDKDYTIRTLQEFKRVLAF